MVDEATGVITTVAGNGGDGFSGDGGPAVDAAIDRPFSVFVDSQGNSLSEPETIAASAR